MDRTPSPNRFCVKTDIVNRTELQALPVGVRSAEICVRQILGHHLGIPSRSRNRLSSPGKLNVIADGLSRQWEGQPRDIGLIDGSEWTVSEDWESNSGLINDLLLLSVFLEVVEAMLQLDQGKEVRSRKRARHQASQYQSRMRHEGGGKGVGSKAACRRRTLGTGCHQNCANGPHIQPKTPLATRADNAAPSV